MFNEVLIVAFSLHDDVALSPPWGTNHQPTINQPTPQGTYGIIAGLLDQGGSSPISVK